MTLIDKKRFADDYCKKMCAGGCSDQARDVCEFMKLLDSQPVAFNVAAVVEHLKNKSFYTEPSFDEDGYHNDDSYEVVYLDSAIEIVEGGGVDDTHSR